MKDRLIKLIHQANPWLNNKAISCVQEDYIQRIQAEKLLSPEWDSLWLILVGPRQAGKTTLAKYLAQQLINQKRFTTLLYLNCDLFEIREWLNSPLFISDAMEQFNLSKPIILLDEVQRLENPGLLLKACADLKLDIKMIATGSSQLEIKSKVQEFLTGRQIEALILPMSYQEIEKLSYAELIYGCYPAIIKSTEKITILRQIYQDYITKDIIEILKVGKPDAMQRLVTLIAHSSGQIVNFNQLANDCLIAVTTIQNYLSILEKTYTISHITPFVGNKRKEITKNPIYYFLDNGFRNIALNNLSTDLEARQDLGLLIQSAVFQEIFKFKIQHFYEFSIHFWRTQSGAEVDFVLYKNAQSITPIEVKYRNINAPTLSRSFRSFIDAYEPKYGYIVTKDYNKKISVNNCEISFISFANLPILLKKLGAQQAT
ncbi:MAG: ATPase [Legionellales bacterium RIFCSPHIGHO2_12_FULL_37_14]|nr:MAG: ATPase [Legionellales bacterium RIFCSPHIGHO2_12_FULL_37_14]